MVKVMKMSGQGHKIRGQGHKKLAGKIMKLASKVIESVGKVLPTRPAPDLQGLGSEDFGVRAHRVQGFGLRA